MVSRIQTLPSECKVQWDRGIEELSDYTGGVIASKGGAKEERRRVPGEHLTEEGI